MAATAHNNHSTGARSGGLSIRVTSAPGQFVVMSLEKDSGFVGLPEGEEVPARRQFTGIEVVAKHGCGCALARGLVAATAPNIHSNGVAFRCEVFW